MRPTRPSYPARLVVTAVAVVAAARWPSAAVAQLDLVLLHANDAHSHFDESDAYGNECGAVDAARGRCYGGFARMARFVDDEKRAARDRGVPALFLLAGDTFQGTPYYTLFKWRLVAEFVGRLRPDVTTLGNHEFDDGVSNLLSYLNETKSIPTVVSNLNTTAEPDLNNLLIPSFTFTLNGTKVGIVGYLTTTTPTMSKTEGVGFFDEIESLKTETKKLRRSGVNIIIGLGHSGIDKDKIIAEEVEDIDLIVGGHSHTFLYSGTPPSIEIPNGPYPFYITNSKNNKTIPILQAYCNSKYIGKVNLKFDSNGDLLDITGSPMLMDHKIKQDPSMLTLLNRWKQSITNITDVIIGRTAVKLKNKICFSSECNLGNLIADSFVYHNVVKRNFSDEYWTDAPIGIISCGSIRTSLIGRYPDGQISFGQLMGVMPFNNTLIKTTISGSSLLEAFEYSVSGNPTVTKGFNLLQVSGVLVEFDLSQRSGHRVSSLFLRCGRCNVPKFEPLELKANYTILMDSYLARGGNNFTSFTKIVKKNELTDTTDLNAATTYIRNISPLTTGIEGRITFKSNNTDELHYRRT